MKKSKPVNSTLGTGLAIAEAVAYGLEGPNTILDVDQVQALLKLSFTNADEDVGVEEQTGPASEKSELVSTGLSSDNTTYRHKITLGSMQSSSNSDTERVNIAVRTPSPNAARSITERQEGCAEGITQPRILNSDNNNDPSRSPAAVNTSSLTKPASSATRGHSGRLSEDRRMVNYDDMRPYDGYHVPEHSNALSADRFQDPLGSDRELGSIESERFDYRHARGLDYTHRPRSSRVRSRSPGRDQEGGCRSDYRGGEGSHYSYARDFARNFAEEGAKGYAKGHVAGHAKGRAEGRAEGHTKGFAEGFAEGYTRRDARDRGDRSH